MKQNAFCPISDKTINEKVTRFNAMFTVLIIIAFSITANVFLVLFLAIDFFLRAIDYGKYSLVGIFSTYLVKLFSTRPNIINAGPKIFATRIGLFLSSLIVISFLLSLNWLTYILAGTLGLFSFLESAFGICVACKIYPFVYKLFYKESVANNYLKFNS
ncbi:MAG: DUF4395 domain-containing protein [Bacteroidetes bacterium]|nr:MAG: DUF4395 domain-containing protein [Bacteroidota bacterium]